MYPLIRVANAMRRAKRKAPLAFDGKEVVTVRIYPWDLDIFAELNNGRTLTIYDIGRLSLAVRVGLVELLRRHKLTMTVAGVSVRYRRRVTLWQKVDVSARFVGADARFFYILQEMSRDGEAVGQALIRMAFVKNGLLPPAEFFEQAGIDGTLYETLPDWINAWIDADASRPWPPEGLR